MCDNYDDESSCPSSYEDESDDYNLQDERDEEYDTNPPRTQSTSSLEDDVDEGAYQDEPIASSEWVEKYSKRQEEINELEMELNKRLAGEVSVSNW